VQDCLRKRESTELDQSFKSPSLFDGFVSILVQELKHKPIRYHLCEREARLKLIDQLIDKFHEAMVLNELTGHKFAEIVPYMPLIVLDLPRENLEEGSREMQKNEVHQYKLYLRGYHKKCYHHWKPADIRNYTNKGFKGTNSGLLLWGERGCGKS